MEKRTRVALTGMLPETSTGIISLGQVHRERARLIRGTTLVAVIPRVGNHAIGVLDHKTGGAYSNAINAGDHGQL